MATELRKLGATVEEGPTGCASSRSAGGLAAASIHTYDDHRVAMCSRWLPSMAWSPGAVPVRILEPHCVAKTFPDYFETLFGVVTARSEEVPVLTVDGPDGLRQGHPGHELAESLGYHVLDSGALYRATGLAAERAGVSFEDGAPWPRRRRAQAALYRLPRLAG